MYIHYAWCFGEFGGAGRVGVRVCLGGREGWWRFADWLWFNINLWGRRREKENNALFIWNKLVSHLISFNVKKKNKDRSVGWKWRIVRTTDLFVGCFGQKLTDFYFPWVIFSPPFFLNKTQWATWKLALWCCPTLLFLRARICCMIMS